MRNKLGANIIRFVALALVQVLILAHIDLFGFINPYLYVLFIILLPIDLPQWQVILWSFIIGLTIDVFQDSGGVQAAASVAVAYLRPFFLRSSFGLSYDYLTVKFYKMPFGDRLLYIVLMVVVHHFVMFLLAFFNFSHIVIILKNTLYSSVFTIVLILLVTSLFKKVNA